MNLLRTIVACALMADASATWSKPRPVEAALTVDFASPGARISPEIYGQFMEHVGRGIYEGLWVGEQNRIPNVSGYRKDVVDALRALQIPLLRWPGGCFADQYDWRDGIGPRASRPVRLNGPYSALESNAFGTHEFMNFAELLGTQPYLSVNTGTLPPLGADRWLEYVTGEQKTALTDERRRNGRPAPWKVKYVGLGNETWGCGGLRTAQDGIDTARVFANAVTASGFDPHRYYLIAPGPTYNLPGIEGYTDTIMRSFNDIRGNAIFDALSLHYYASQEDIRLVSPDPRGMPSIGFVEKEWFGLLQSAARMNDGIVAMSGVMDKYDPGKKIAIAVDEWGAFHAPAPGSNPHDQYYQISLIDGEVAALTLNAFQRHTDRVRIANNSMLINTLHALILTDGPRMVVTPVYHVFMMYKPFKNAVPYPVRLATPTYNYQGASMPMLDVTAARGEDGRVYLAIANVDPHHGARLTTNLRGPASGSLLTGATMDAHNDFGSPNNISPKPFSGSSDTSGNLVLDIPAKAIVVISVGDASQGSQKESAN
jgi:alpha-N-arabinofuranosidase